MIVLGGDTTPQINTGTILAAGSYLSEAFDATRLKGFFSLQWIVTGDGTMKAEALICNNGSDFLDVADDITVGQLKTSGDGGNNMVSFEVPPCKQLKIKFTETGGLATIAVAASLHAI